MSNLAAIDKVQIVVEIGQAQVRKRRAELAVRQESKRLVIDELPEPEIVEYDLGDLS